VITQQAFLARVSTRLGRRSSREAGPLTWSPRPASSAGVTDPSVLADRFAAEVERIGGRVHRAAGPAGVGQLIVGVVAAEAPSGLVVRWEDPTLAGLDLDELLQAAGYQVASDGGEGAGSLIRTAEQAVVGITGCDAAIAETGSLVLGTHALGSAGGQGRGRVISLLPPVHVAVVYRDQIVRNGEDIMRLLAASPLPPQVVFVSGPSRSSDIENDLSIGVHGPRMVHVILVG
jgi:L-lactate dehydrogenase complex protein LldG